MVLKKWVALFFSLLTVILFPFRFSCADESLLPELNLVSVDEEESEYEVVDAYVDRAHLPDGRVQLKVYAAPRMIYEDAAGQLQVRPQGWNWFHETGESRLRGDAPVPGYRYQVRAGPDLIGMAAGAMEQAGKTIMPAIGAFTQRSNDAGVTVSRYANYSGPQKLDS